MVDVTSVAEAPKQQAEDQRGMDLFLQEAVEGHYKGQGVEPILLPARKILQTRVDLLVVGRRHHYTLCHWQN